MKLPTGEVLASADDGRDGIDGREEQLKAEETQKQQRTVHDVRADARAKGGCYLGHSAAIDVNTPLRPLFGRMNTLPASSGIVETFAQNVGQTPLRRR